MSNKTTINFSDITPIIRNLINKGEKYHLGVLGKVDVVGYGDEMDLRVLIYKGGVILEQLRKMNDWNVDDVIVSETFNFDQVPDKWALERIMDYYNYPDCKEYQRWTSVIHFKKFIEQFVK